MDIERLEIFTRDVVEEYEAIRQSGVINMWDVHFVQSLAKTALANLSTKEYCELLRGYGTLLRHYGIAQE